MEQKSDKEREFFEDILTTTNLAKFLLDFGITDIEQLGGRQYLLDEVLPEEFARNYALAKPELVDCILKPKNQALGAALADSLGGYCEYVLKGLDERKKVVYYYFTTSIEPLLALDLLPICYEVPGGLQAVLYSAGCEAAIDRLEAEGYPSYLCSAQKSGAGILLQGLLPKPDVILKQTAICDPSNMMYDWTAVTFGTPMITVESPYYANERAFKFFVGEVRRMIEQLEEMSGNSLDEDKLREYVEIGNEGFDYFLKIQQLRKNIPCPDTSWHRPIDEAFMLLLGLPVATSWFRRVYEDVRARQERGEGVIPEGKKEIRCAWGWGWQAYDLPFFDWLEEEHGATYLESGLTYLPPFMGLVDTTNVDTMIEGLAWRMFNWPMVRQGMSFSDLWVNDIVSVAKEYKADCLILGAHTACKHFWPLNKLLSDQVRDEVGIPSLRFEFDIFDARFTSPAELRRLTSEFFATL